MAEENLDIDTQNFRGVAAYHADEGDRTQKRAEPPHEYLQGFKKGFGNGGMVFEQKINKYYADRHVNLTGLAGAQYTTSDAATATANGFDHADAEGNTSINRGGDGLSA